MARLFYTIRHILYTQIVSKFQRPEGFIRFGKHNIGNPRILSFTANTRVITGNFCSFAENVTIIGAGGEHPIKSVSTFTLKSYLFKLPDVYDPQEARLNQVTIGNDVWVGTGATIFYGINIGDGAVIGAGAVVTCNVPPYAIVAGVPSKILRYRFSQEEINELLSIAWWNWSTEKIMSNIDLFNNVDLFIKKFGITERNSNETKPKGEQSG